MSSSPRDTLRLELPSVFESVEEAVERTQAFLKPRLDDEELAFQVVLLTSEAVTNAVEHGNALDADKTVHVRVSLLREYVEVAVEDEGAGFDRSAIDDPRADENLLHEGGRGIFFIETMADDVRYEEDGRRVRFRFRRDRASRS